MRNDKIPESVPEHLDIDESTVTRRQHTVLHNDDFMLKFLHPKDLSKYKHITSLSEEEIVERFAIFSRIFFDQILPLDKKDFDIIKDPLTGEYQYFVKAGKQGNE